jgi:transposase
MADSKRTPRRRHAGELKAQVLRECQEPGASVASVALAHGLNANLVHKWRRCRANCDVTVKPMRAGAEFIALPLMRSPPAAAADICIEVRRGTTTMSVTWPIAAAADCAAWMRELLR